jgi:hypothetical protein
MSQDEVRHCAAQVQSYLCADPAMFITTEYLIELGGKNGKGDRIFDFLAWHAREKRLYVVEATTNIGMPKKLVERITDDWGRKDMLKAVLGRNGVVVGEDGLRWWVFVRRAFLERFREALPPEIHDRVRLTALEATLFYPDYRKCRRSGDEPEGATG